MSDDFNATNGSKAPKRLTPEEIEASASRMSSVRRKEMTLPDLVPKRTLNKSQEEASVRRLHDQAAMMAQRRAEAAEKKQDAAKNSGKTHALDEQQLGDAINRLYNRSVLIKQETSNKLEKKYIEEHKRSKFTRAQQSAVNDRLFNESRAKTADRKTRLFDRYVTDNLPKCAKRTEAQWSETADRLYQKPN